MTKKKPTVHLIGNAHIDPVWLWSWQEGVEVILATFRQSMNLIKEHHGYIFTASSALFYKWVEETDLKLFREIQGQVKKGRWCIVGGWWVEPDCNMPSGESLVRQGLYGQRYFKDKFGVITRTGYNPDTFGHNAMLPQILKKSGIDYYVFTKPTEPDKQLPTLFCWESPDGSQVLTFKIYGPGLYGTWLRKELIQKMKDANENTKDSHVMVFFGCGDHGNGTTTEELTIIQKMKERLKRVEFRFSSPSIYFNAIHKENSDLPVIRGEIQHYARGCYSAYSEIKYLNRQAEHLLVTSEKMSIVANMAAKYNYPKENLTQAWQNLLFCQFHDILAGTSIIEAYEDVMHILGESIHKANETINTALQLIAGSINTQEDGLPLLIFNPHTWAVRTPVEFEHLSAKPVSVYDGKKLILTQDIKSSGTAINSRRRMVFVTDLPPLGYKTYFLRRRRHGKPVKNDRLKINNSNIENKWLKIKIDSRTGYISRFYDKQNHVEILCNQGGIPIVIKDESDAWGHGQDEFRNEVGKFKKREIKILGKGTVRATIRVKYEYNKSALWQDFTLYKDLNGVHTKVFIDWREQHKLLKIGFPVNLKTPKVTYQIQYGSTTRPANGKEEPGLQWFDVTGKTANYKGTNTDIDYGLSILNDSKYSFDVKGSEMRITVLRSPIYAHGTFADAKLDPNYDYRYIDQGIQTFSYVLLPHRGILRKSIASKRADEVNLRPITLVHHNHPGDLPQERYFIKIDRDNVIVSVLKQSEDNEDIILRCYETEGKTTLTEILLPVLKRSWKFTINPYEIKTFKIPVNSTGKIEEANLLEFSRSGGSRGIRR
ncbi:MAG: alpha-mannosidase [Planctomycetes bacterium]|nr:alpha-mannosidase [Planctomycetota bacterium]